MSAFTTFKGAAKRLDDIDLPRIASRIGVGEDELHALIDTETTGKGFDAAGRPRILFEPHVFYRNLSGAARDKAVAAGLAYKKWGEKPYGKESEQYPKLMRAMEIDETAALKACSWGLGQVLGENHVMAGYSTVQSMVLHAMDDEEHHLDMMVSFVIAAGIDDDMRILAALKRPTTPDDCRAIVRVYNGPGYEKNGYHTKFAKAHNKWRGIPDTPYDPAADGAAVLLTAKDQIKALQRALAAKGYPEVGEDDGKAGNKTRTAILAFEAENGLPLTGKATVGLLALVLAAEKREIGAARASATKKDLADKPAISIMDRLQKVGTSIVAASGIGAVLSGEGDIQQAIDGVNKLKSLGNAIASMSPWIIGAAAGGVAIYIGSAAINRMVADYREGRSL